MKAEELRMGNYVDIINRINEIHMPMNIVAEVGEVHLFKVLLYNPDIPIIRQNVTEYTNVSDLSPIELTEEWLIKLGFLTFNGYQIYNYPEKEFQIDLAPKESGDLYWFFIGNNREDTPYCVSIKYVHQLQNLFYCLTGEELIINE